MKVKEAGNTTETKYEVCNTRIFIQLFGFIKWSIITRYLQETTTIPTDKLKYYTANNLDTKWIWYIRLRCMHDWFDYKSKEAKFLKELDV